MSDLSQSQRQELDEYIKRISSGKLIQSHVYANYKIWCADNGKKPINAETLRLWVLGRRKPKIFNSFYEYIVDQGLRDESNINKLLFYSINNIFKSGHVDESKILARLIGNYKITRRLWYPLHSDDFLECPVEFYETSAGIIFTERETFLAGYNTKEIYTGYTFVFGPSIWIIAHEEKENAIKFLTIHECAPPIMSQSKTINICKGTLVAVSGIGPHVTHRFVLSRVTHPIQSCRIISKHQIALDQEYRNYLYVNDEQK